MTRAMNTLNDIPMTVVKIDDILVSGSDDTEHLQNLKKVFEVLENMGVTIINQNARFFRMKWSITVLSSIPVASGQIP